MIRSQTCQQPATVGGWFVRAVALLLVAVGVQAGSFRDLADAKNRYFGTLDYRVAVRPEPRQGLAPRAQADRTLESDPAIGTGDVPAAAPLRSWPLPARTAFTRRSPLAATDSSRPRRLLPDPTGPPRA